ncbi:uncharacterized mitochondrial protein AtMg00860-like, partial [Vigna umbellata]|uniref:uncharacterized mitochondrial protein AtMg00860-like n=1 Tax=Vigna umbellata TaxID=87088 RepID=UPI001F5F5C8A
MSPDPTKIQAMVQWPTLTCVKGLRGFLGLTGFYRKFVQNYAAIDLPLMDLLKKGNFQWSPAAKSAFDALKSAMTSTSVLALPEFSKSFYIQMDASGSAMGAVLLQENHPIAFYSKFLVDLKEATSTFKNGVAPQFRSGSEMENGWRYSGAFKVFDEMSGRILDVVR